MKTRAILIAALLVVLPRLGLAQATPKEMATAYGSLADTILAVKQAEANFVRALLAGHLHGAEALMKAGKHELAAAEMALFANEGDNAIGGVRKRLLEGGHHHNADGEAKGIYEPGFVVVTRKAKTDALAASAAMRQAKTEAERKQAWDKFAAVAAGLLAGH